MKHDWEAWDDGIRAGLTLGSEVEFRGMLGEFQGRL